MVDAIIVIVIFVVALFFTESFIGSLIIAAVFAATVGLTPDWDKLKIEVETRIEQVESGGTPTPEVVRRNIRQMFADQLNLQPGRITDKLRNQEVIDLWTVNGELEARRENGERFHPDVLMHEGTAYACQQDGINCYIVR